jgi:membrane protein YdbS with pleckstrin-like domain
MENSTPVSKNALQYRLTMNECMGVIIALAVTVLIAITFYFIKLKHAVLYDVLAFLVILVLQFVILYFVSLMQYKNLRYTIGQNAISFQRGAFGIERETIPFEKIKNSTFDQTLLQRLFSVGDITIDQEEEKYMGRYRFTYCFTYFRCGISKRRCTTNYRCCGNCYSHSSSTPKYSINYTLLIA